MSIDLSLVPPVDLDNLANTILRCVSDLYEDPDFAARFDEWMACGEKEKYVRRMAT